MPPSTVCPAARTSAPPASTPAIIGFAKRLPHGAQLEIDAQDAQVGTARKWAAAQLAATRQAPSQRSDAVIILSELVTNAVKHCPGGIMVRIRLRWGSAGLAIMVADDSTEIPFKRPFLADSAESGRGLHLVDALAKHWGSYLAVPPAKGKVVWALFTPLNVALAGE